MAFVDEDPEWSARFVNDLIAPHIERIARLKIEAASAPVMEKQRQRLEARWREAKENLAAFRERHETGLLMGDEEEVRRVLTQLQSQRVDAEARALQLQAQVSYLEGQLEKEPPEITAESRVTESESVSLLKSRILELEMERSELISTYTEDSKIIRDLGRRIEETRRLLATKEEKTLSEEMTATNPTYQTLKVELVAAQSELTAAQARFEALSGQISRYRKHFRELEETATELATLESEVSRADEVYQESQKQSLQASLSSTLDESGLVNISIVEAAKVPLNPEPRNAPSKYLLGALLGLAAGVALAFLRAWLDTSVKSSVEAARLTGVPVLGEIPLK